LLDLTAAMTFARRAEAIDVSSIVRPWKFAPSPQNEAGIPSAWTFLTAQTSCVALKSAKEPDMYFPAA
jgi:hypothetical protein